ncbi:hypothetical protein [Angelakisella massiliensis]|uniref:hypothetical protein n=1 Tax=Angelakisella massiliensis TaxID=1871018 RepID=UPI0024B21451|nr:hypothetical protein [Angelakisella massiliensis]
MSANIFSLKICSEGMVPIFFSFQLEHPSLLPETKVITQNPGLLLDFVLPFQNKPKGKLLSEDRAAVALSRGS